MDFRNFVHSVRYLVVLPVYWNFTNLAIDKLERKTLHIVRGGTIHVLVVIDISPLLQSARKYFGERRRRTQ